ncbi:GNAT family N-acetyltransferase [Heyndrickxia sp. NPDC080065]|uniref:GNAT family N-acetyltransferase n=1 Tax=Heyndrickxia sp. NPDC080065 TaxID=3390568 RepID=UPI003D05B057
MKPVLIDFPDRIETERLYIRPCMPGDGKDVYESINHSLNDLKTWLAFAHKDQNLDDVESGIRNSYAEFIKRQDFRLHIYRKSDNKFIGSTGLHRINWETKVFEIGYWIDSRYTKNGYITEAVEGLTSFAFKQFKAERIEIRCDPKNTNSRRVAERLGFTLDGILRNNTMSADGKSIRSTCVFSMLKNEWE